MCIRDSFGVINIFGEYVHIFRRSYKQRRKGEFHDLIGSTVALYLVYKRDKGDETLGGVTAARCV